MKPIKGTSGLSARDSSFCNAALFSACKHSVPSYPPCCSGVYGCQKRKRQEEHDLPFIARVSQRLLLQIVPKLTFPWEKLEML